MKCSRRLAYLTVTLKDIKINDPSPVLLHRPLMIEGEAGKRSNVRTERIAHSHQSEKMDVHWIVDIFTTLFRLGANPMSNAATLLTLG